MQLLTTKVAQRHNGLRHHVSIIKRVRKFIWIIPFEARTKKWRFGVLTLLELAWQVPSPVWSSFSNARLDCTIAFLSLSWSKNIYVSPHLKS